MASVVSVASSPSHSFSKAVVPSISILAGLGVEGDAHAGSTVKHRSRVAVDPTQPNLRQVHLIHAELFVELRESGYEIAPGDLGENIVTEGIALLDLPTDTVLRIGSDVALRITGLRNPCSQIEAFRTGLLKQVVHSEDGRIVRKAGIMSVVDTGGVVRPGDRIEIVLPAEPFRSLERV